MSSTDYTTKLRKPFISVICTAKNASRTIEPVISSIMAQSFDRWELVIVDDGSTDETPSLLRKYLEPEGRIRVITTSGIGRGRALNLAIQHCKGELIANIDADDPSHYQRLEFQYQAAQDRPDLALICTATTHLYDDEEMPQTPCRYNTEAVRDVTEAIAWSNPINHSSVIITKAALERVGGYAVNRTSLFDYELWVRLARAGYRLCRLDYPLASKRIHANQSFETKRRLSYLSNAAKLQREAIGVVKPNGFAWFALLLKFAWGLLPQRQRISAKSFSVSKKLGGR